MHLHGEDVYGGDPEGSDGGPAKTSYDDGVRFGSLCIAVEGLVQFISALVLTLPIVIHFFGYRVLYFLAHLVGLVSYVFPAWPKAMFKAPTMILAGLSGVFQAITSMLPFAIVGILVPDEDMGLWVGILNVVQVAAQLLLSFLAGYVMEAFSDKGFGKVGIGIAFGGLWALVGLPVILLLRVPPSPTSTTSDSSSSSTSTTTTTTVPTIHALPTYEAIVHTATATTTSGSINRVTGRQLTEELD